MSSWPTNLSILHAPDHQLSLTRDILGSAYDETAFLQKVFSYTATICRRKPSGNRRLRFYRDISEILTPSYRGVFVY